MKTNKKIKNGFKAKILEKKSKGANLSLKNEFNLMTSKNLLPVFPLSVCRFR